MLYHISGREEQTGRKTMFKTGIIKSLFKTLKEPKNSQSVFLLRKHNKSQWRYNQALCYYLKTKASLDNMKRLNLVLPDNVKKLGGE
jgi:hypothetical protein